MRDFSVVAPPRKDYKSLSSLSEAEGLNLQLVFSSSNTLTKVFKEAGAFSFTNRADECWFFDQILDVSVCIVTETNIMGCKEVQHIMDYEYSFGSIQLNQYWIFHDHNLIEIHLKGW